MQSKAQLFFIFLIQTASLLLGQWPQGLHHCPSHVFWVLSTLSAGYPFPRPPASCATITTEFLSCLGFYNNLKLVAQSPIPLNLSSTILSVQNHPILHRTQSVSFAWHSTPFRTLLLPNYHVHPSNENVQNTHLAEFLQKEQNCNSQVGQCSPCQTWPTAWFCK